MNLVQYARSIAPATAASAVALLLAACGGGGGDSGGPAPSNGPTAEGAYSGTLTGGSGNAFQLVVLENGEYWALYGTAISNAFIVSGFIQGNGTSNNGTFTSNNARDFGFAPSIAGTINATYTTSPRTINGTASNSAGSVSFSGGTTAGSTYDYDAQASISSIAGVWNLTELDGEGIVLNVSSSGSFSAQSSQGCSFSGTVTPRASGKNVFNLAFTFGASPCALPGTAASGIAVAYPLTNGTTQLIVAATEGSRTYGAAAVGTR